MSSSLEAQLASPERNKTDAGLVLSNGETGLANLLDVVDQFVGLVQRGDLRIRNVNLQHDHGQ